MTATVTPEIKNFIADHIDSVELLEVLLLVWRSRHRSWTAVEVGEELRTDPKSASRRLETLHKKRLVCTSEANPSQFRYQPASRELDQLVQEISLVYQERRFTVIDLIFAKPIDNIQTFADAFKFRRDAK